MVGHVTCIAAKILRLGHPVVPVAYPWKNWPLGWKRKGKRGCRPDQWKGDREHLDE